MPIRLRLAVWSGAILAVGLIAFSTLIYLLAGHTLRDQGDQVIAGRAHRVDTLLRTAIGVRSQAAEEARAVKVFSSPGVVVALVDAAGKVLRQTPGSTEPAPTCAGGCGPAGAGALARGLAALPTGAYYDGYVDGEPFRVYALRRTDPGPVRAILVGHSIQYIDDTLTTLLVVLIAGSAICLLLVTAAAWLLARRALSPIAALTHTAASIAASGQFSTRVQTRAGKDEVGQLAATFNAMLNRLASLHASQRRFVADASHELRAPLTTIRGNAELLLLDPDAPAAERVDALRDIAAEAGRLTRLVEGLLALARGDAQQQARPQPVKLHELLLSVWQAMAERPGAPRITVESCVPTLITADPDRLEQLLIILLDNAIKYTPAEGAVTLSLAQEGAWAVLRVRDTGIGIHPDDLPHIFERFYRADPARAHIAPSAGTGDEALDLATVPGTGLGLAIARQIVEEAGGTIAAESVLGQGAALTVRFPPRPGARGRTPPSYSSHLPGVG